MTSKFHSSPPFHHYIPTSRAFYKHFQVGGGATHHKQNQLFTSKNLPASTMKIGKFAPSIIYTHHINK